MEKKGHIIDNHKSLQMLGTPERPSSNIGNAVQILPMEKSAGILAFRALTGFS